VLGGFEFTIKLLDLILCHVGIGATGQYQQVCLAAPAFAVEPSQIGPLIHGMVT
jgi:hypothetical protein